MSGNCRSARRIYVRTLLQRFSRPYLSPQAEKVRRFAERLKEYTDVPVYFYDERLSSFEAEQKLANTGLTRKKKRKRSDAIAAAAILQAFLDSRQTG